MIASRISSGRSCRATRAFCFAVAVAIVGSTVPALAETPRLTPSLTTSLDRVVARHQSGHRPGSYQIAVRFEGGTEYLRSGGVAKWKPMPIGVESRLFTIVAIMQLVDARRLDLDARVATIVPDAPHGAEYTARDLLTNAVRLPDPVAAETARVALGAKVSVAEIFALDAKRPYPEASAFNAGDIDYIILARVVEVLSGEAYAAYERRNVLERAGLRETSFVEERAPIASLRIDRSYDSRGGRLDPSWLFGCADVFSTAADLVRLDAALTHGDLISQAALREMTHAMRASSDSEPRAGLGVSVYAYDHRYSMAVDGQSVLRASASNDIALDDRFAVAIVTDGSLDAAMFVDHELRDAIVPPRSLERPDAARDARFLDVMRAVYDGTEPSSAFDSAASPEIARGLSSLRDALQGHGRPTAARFIDASDRGASVESRYRVTFPNRTNFTCDSTTAAADLLLSLVCRAS